MACLSLAFAPVGWATDTLNTGWIQVLPSGGCKLNNEALRCDLITQRLRSMHLSPNFFVSIVVDDAPYESVIALLDALKKLGIGDAQVIPPFFGTNLSKSVKHWIRFIVEGDINHPFPMVLIATKSLRTWREQLIVLPVSQFAIVDRLAAARIAHGICATSAAPIPEELLGREHRLLLFQHSDDLTQTCLLPRTAASCEFLSSVMHLANVDWSAS
jgi:hypothetical protein